jgi:peroxiredoxin
MSQRSKTIILAVNVVGLLFLVAYGCFADRLFAAEIPANVRNELTKRFRELDADQNDSLSERELGERLFEFLDANQDTEVLLDEVFSVVRDKGIDALKAVAENQSAPEVDSVLEPIRQGPKRLVPGDHQIGRLIPDLAMTDATGQSFKLSDFKTAKAIVVAITNTTCPICKKYTPTLAKLEADYREQGIAFIYVNPTASDKQATIDKVIAEQGLKGRYVRDTQHAIVSALGATRTTDVFVLASDRTLMYRGAVDDQYGFGYSLEAPKTNYLIAAIEAVLEDSRPLIPATEAPGCPLDVKPTKANELSEVTYHHQIARIFQNHCIQCHREDGVGPFPLDDFASVDAQSGAIRRAIEQDLMPPWFAAKPKDGSTSAFINDCSLSATDKSLVLNWLANGKPEGNKADAPKARVFTSDWQIGKPDLVLQIPNPIAVKATGVMPYQEVTIETGFTEDKFVSALEVMPTAREVVHHVLVFVLPPSRDSNGDQDRRVGADESDGFFAAYAPGYDALQFNDGFGKMIPAGSRMKFQIHYTPNGSATEDQSKIGMIFASKPPENLVNVTGIAQPRLAIPPHADNYQVTASVKLPHDATVLAFFPHMHLRGKAFRYEAVFEDGTKQVLLDIPRYDFNWQLSYRFAEPRTFAAGTTIVATAWYDNSKNNPANPDPDRTVTWGQQTYDEMMIGYVEYHSEEGRVRRVPNRPVANAIRNLGNGEIIAAKFKQLDRNRDQRLSRDELPSEMRERLMKLDENQDEFLSLEEAKKLKDVVSGRR